MEMKNEQIKNKPNSENPQVYSVSNENIEMNNISKFCIFLFSLHCGISTIHELAVQFYLKDKYKLELSEFTLLNASIELPFLFQPFFLLIIEFYPLFGFRRKIYFIICAFLNSLLWFLMAYFNYMSLATEIILLMLINLFLGFIIGLSESLLFEVNKLNNTKEQIITNRSLGFIFLIRLLARLIASFLKGAFLFYLGIRNIFLIAGICPILPLFAGIFIEEKQITTSPKINLENRSFKNEYLELIVREESFEQSITKGLDINKKKAYVSITNTCCDIKNAFFNKNIIISILIFVIFFFAGPNYNGYLFYYNINQLGYTELDLGFISIFASLSSILQMFFYRLKLKKVKGKKLIIYSAFLFIFASFIPCIIINNLNSYLGINNLVISITHVFFISALAEMISIPVYCCIQISTNSMILDKVLPFIVIIFKIGNILSAYFSLIFTRIYSITEHNFQNSNYLLVTCNVTRFIPLIFLYFIPEDSFNKPTFEDAKDDHSRNLMNKENILENISSFHSEEVKAYVTPNQSNTKPHDLGLFYNTDIYFIENSRFNL